MSVAVNVVAIVSAISAVAYGFLLPKVDEDREYYKNKFEGNTIKKAYFNSLNKVLVFITYHFGKPFSRQSFNLSTNLAVFYSFSSFFLIYIFTGHGSFGDLEILSGDVASSTRFFVLLISALYFRFLYINYKSLRTDFSAKIAVSRKVLLVLVSLLPSVLISLIISFEWNSYHTASLNIKTIAILSLAITLSAAILGFCGDGKGAKKGYGAVVFNVTYLSLVGLSAVISAFLKIQDHSLRAFVTLFVFLILSTISYTLWKKKKNFYLFNVLLVAVSIFVKNHIPGVFGMDIVSSTLLYFFVALPFINGLLDYISLGISRIFARKIMEKGRVSTLITHVIFDLLIALILLYLLILIFVLITNFFNVFLANNSGYSVPLNYIFETAIEKPLSPNGIWFYSMMFSTLIPTFLHFFIVVSSLIFNHPFEALRQSIIGKINKPKLVAEDKLLLILYMSIARIGSIATIVLLSIFLIEYIGPLYMLWIEESTNHW